MIIGSGMIAAAFSAFRENDRVVIFASGVSNSLETDPAEFAREKRLLLQARSANPDRLLVYFGTCSVDDPDRGHTPYVIHKLEMESLLEVSPGPWMVMRLPLAIGPGHRGAALAQFLYERISRGEPFEVWTHAARYPIDVADVFRITSRLVDDPSMWHRRINVALRAFPVLEFVHIMERIVGKRAVCTLVPKGRHYEVSCPEVAAVAADLNLDFSDRYLERVLRRYFASP